MKIHQLLPNFSYGDAIGDDTLAMRNILRELGHESEIFAGVIHSKLVDDAIHWNRYKEFSHSDTILIYHFSVGSEIIDTLMTLPDRLIIIFHNITPPHWFFGISPHMTELAQEGMEQLAILRDRVEIAWADSRYNAGILKELGYQRIRVLPIIVDFRRLGIAANTVFRKQWASTQKTWLFVGRVSPNKCHEDIIRTFSVYKSKIEPHSRLILVGDVRNCWRYADAMTDFVKSMGLADVHFPGMVDDDELVALFEMADLFLCMSEHEGFCVPVLEAMHFGIPVMAYAAGAVPETMAGAGVLIHEKDPFAVAEVAHEIITNEPLKTSVIQKQKTRFKEFVNTDFKGRVKELLAEL